MHLRSEGDAPEKCQRRAESHDAKRGYASRRKLAKVSALQNRGVKQPHTESANRLHPGQRFADEETAGEAKCVKCETPPKQPRDRREKIGQRRQVIKDRTQLMRLELAFLHQIHHARDASERERAVGHERHRSVKFQPRIGRQFHRVPDIDRREQGKGLNQENQRRRERSHERKPIGRTNQHVDQGDRPGEKNENFKQVRDRTPANRMTTNRQERCLKNKSKPDRKKIKSPRPKNSRAQRGNRAHHSREKTNRRNNEKMSIHQVN